MIDQDRKRLEGRERQKAGKKCVTEKTGNITGRE